MLIGIEGGLGSGKTIMLTRYLQKDFNTGNLIRANYKLKNGLEYESIDLKELLSNSDSRMDFTNCTLGIDEITVFVDCRTTGSKKNRLFSYFVLQSRKRGVNVYFTTQDLTMLDFRLTNHMHFAILCEDIFDKGKEIIEDYKKYVIFDFRNRRKPVRNEFIMDISKYYDFYDTDEIIEPF